MTRSPLSQSNILKLIQTIVYAIERNQTDHVKLIEHENLLWIQARELYSQVWLPGVSCEASRAPQENGEWRRSSATGDALKTNSDFKIAYLLSAPLKVSLLPQVFILTIEQNVGPHCAQNQHLNPYQSPNHFIMHLPPMLLIFTIFMEGCVSSYKDGSAKALCGIRLPWRFQYYISPVCRRLQSSRRLLWTAKLCWPGVLRTIIPFQKHLQQEFSKEDRQPLSFQHQHYNQLSNCAVSHTSSSHP